ncbi:MAG TPA: alpha/beta hydrolase [Candidatus Binataceae bacterium]|nr:alpha/beta hydrolase [Candidatus Binataceae bacterium]
MPHITTDDGVRLYYEEAGSGLPLIFVHEFAGDARSYEAQLRYFSRRYHCVAYNARGYPPSDVPADAEKYSQARARDDIRAVARGLNLERPHIVGISMGAFATLHYGLAYPSEARSLVVAGCGYGAEPSRREQFQRESEAAAERFTTQPMAQAAGRYALGTTRVQLQNKDPRGWEEFRAALAEHSPLGSALTLRGVQKRRPSLYDLTDTLRQMTLPVLLMTGDEDEPCLEPMLMLKRTIPTSALVVFPRTGHAVNLEEPALFHQFIGDFFHQVETGRWNPRDPRSLGAVIL